MDRGFGPAMNARPAKNNHELFLEYVVRSTKARVRLVELSSAALGMLALAGVYALAMVLADHVAGGLGPGVRRIALLAFVTVEATAAVCLLVLPFLRRLNDLYVTRTIERAHPQFRTDLTAALQLSEEPGASRDAVAAVVRQAAREAAGTDVRSSISAARVRLAGAALGGAVALLLLYAAVAPKSPWVSLRRAFGDDALTAPTATVLLRVEPPDGTTVLTGEPVDFRAEILRPAGEARVEISRDGGRTFLQADRVRLTERAQAASGGVRHAGTWAGATATDGVAAFRIVCGDAVSLLRTLRVLPEPAVGDIRIEYEWPEYTGWGRKRGELGVGRVEALPGTRVRVTARTNLPVRSASLVFEKAEPIIMEARSVGTTSASGPATTAAQAGREVSAAFNVIGDDGYRIVFRGEQDFVRGESMTYEITALADRPPAVTVVTPQEEVAVPAGGTVRLSAEAGDDFGLAGLTLEHEGPGGAGRVTVADFALPGPTARLAELALPVDRLGRPGETVLCTLEARDFRPPGGQIGRSDPVRIRILPPEEGRQEASSEGARSSEPGSSDAAPDPDAPASDPGEAPTRAANPQDDDPNAREQLPRGVHVAGDIQGRRGESVPTVEQGSGSPRRVESAAETLGAGPQDAQRLETLRRHYEGQTRPADPRRPSGNADEAPDGQDRAGQADQPGGAGSADQQPRASAGEPENAGEPDQGSSDIQPAAVEEGGQEQAGDPDAPGVPGREAPGPSDEPSAREGQDVPGRGGEQAPRGDGRAGEGALAGRDEDGPGTEAAEPAGGEGRQGQGEQGGDAAEPRSQHGAGAGAADEGVRGQPDQSEGSGNAEEPGDAARGRSDAGGESEGGQGDAGGRAQDRPGDAGGAGESGQVGTGGAAQPGDGGGTDSRAPSGGGGPGGGGLSRPGESSGPPPEEPPEVGEVSLPDGQAELDPLESIGRALHEARRQARGGRVDPQLLRGLGMTAPQFVAFVEEYAGRYERLGRTPRRTERPGRTLPGAVRLSGREERQAGRSATAGLRSSGGADLPGDDLRELGRGRRERVAPAYRRHVQEYFRAVSEGISEPAPTTATAE